MRVAIAQIAPVFLQRDATLAKVADWVARAAAAGARLVAFGETLVPAYPLWLSRIDGARWDAADLKRLHARYVDQAVCIEDGQLDSVRDAARKHRIAVVLGVAERPRDRGGHTIFCTRVIMGADGQVLSAHRKLIPTYEERLAWAMGDGAGLVTHRVDEFCVSALNCWENWMPLPRAALYGQGADLHVMLWPGSRGLTEDITRFVAREGRLFVLSASNLLRPSDIPPDVPERARFVGTSETLYDGGSCIAGPDGAWLVEPTSGREALLTADVDLARVSEERQNFDPAGHYARPDVLRLEIDARRQQAAVRRE